MKITNRLVHAWNAFNGRDPTPQSFTTFSSYRPDRKRFYSGVDKSIITAVYNRIALDVTDVSILHVNLDDKGRYKETRNSALNSCLNVSANIDQTPKAFLQDLVLSMFDEGCIAAVPTQTTFNPELTSGYDINSLRVGKIVEWMPKHVKASVYNEDIGAKQEVVVPKKTTAIIENPFYAVMNEKNSTIQRLIRKMVILDAIDEQSGSGKFNMIIQLPYAVQNDSRRMRADKRIADIEEQLASNKFGIAYIDGTEKITQLNRPLENNLMSQIEYLTNLMFAQLGITQAILDGTADEKTMLNYHNRIIKPIISAISDEFKRKFLTKTARTQGQSIFFYQDPFKLVPASQMADIADKFTRNEIMSPNEIRQIVGMKPSDDPKSDELKNRNISEPSGEETDIYPYEDQYNEDPNQYEGYE